MMNKGFILLLVFHLEVLGTHKNTYLLLGDVT